MSDDDAGGSRYDGRMSASWQLCCAHHVVCWWASHCRLWQSCGYGAHRAHQVHCAAYNALHCIESNMLLSICPFSAIHMFVGFSALHLLCVMFASRMSFTDAAAPQVNLCVHAASIGSRHAWFQLWHPVSAKRPLICLILQVLLKYAYSKAPSTVLTCCLVMTLQGPSQARTESNFATAVTSAAKPCPFEVICIEGSPPTF